MDLSIFKAYDVRGLYGEQIDGDVAEAVGRAFAQVLSDLAGKPTTDLRIGVRRMSRPRPTRSSPVGLPARPPSTRANARPIPSATSPSICSP